MARIKLDPPFSPRLGSILQAMLIGRVSNPGSNKQDEKSNADQAAEFTKWVEDRADVPINVNVISGTGSGEYLDREESERAYKELETGRYDLVIAEDLGRIFRRVHAFLFCEAAEDVGTRVIAPNDFLDTAQENWRMCAFFAAMRHEMYNADTSKRIRRTLRNRFQGGEVVQFVISGIIKPEKKSHLDKIHDSQLSKDPVAEAVYDEWFTMLEKGATYAEVADWLNAIGFPTGPHCRNKQWDGKMVARVTHNKILKGVRVRNERMSKRVNKTGRRKSIKAPAEDRLERFCPNLVFIEPKRYDRVIRQVDALNSKYQRVDDASAAMHTRGPKKRTRWPGQHLYCEICRHMFVWGGHGQTDRLMCDGCRKYNCWQAITVDGPQASKKLSDAIFSAIEKLDGFDPCLQDQLREELRLRTDSRARQLSEINAKLSRLQHELDHVVAFILNGGKSKRLSEEVHRLEAEIVKQELDRDELLAQPEQMPQLPPMNNLKQLARESMERHADDTYAFGRLLRSWIPKIWVHPFRLFDGGQILLRARFELSLASLVPNGAGLDGVSQALTQSLVVDLFDPPNERDRFRGKVMNYKTDGLTEPQIAAQLGITKTAVQRAVALQRKMDERGLTDPYIPVLEPPDDFTKLKRHLHPRCKLRPLPE